MLDTGAWIIIAHNPTGDDRIYYGRSVTSGDYLRLLAANGYTLSAVEEVVTGTRTSDEVYDEYLAETGKE